MEKLIPLTDFLSSIKNDNRINPTHIATYTALLNIWVLQNYRNPISAISHQIMTLAKISGANTYYKTLRELNEYGYIQYIPSAKKNETSKVFLAIKKC